MSSATILYELTEIETPFTLVIIIIINFCSKIKLVKYVLIDDIDARNILLLSVLMIN